MAPMLHAETRSSELHFLYTGLALLQAAQSGEISAVSAF